MSLPSVLAEVELERRYQNGKWGQGFDNLNTINDWSAYISQWLGKATSHTQSPVGGRDNLIQVAALAVAAVEAFDRSESWAERHYD